MWLNTLEEQSLSDQERGQSEKSVPQFISVVILS